MNLSSPIPDFSQERATDALAMADIFERNYVALVYFAFKILESKPEAEDIVQDAFLNFFDHRQNILQDSAAIKGYLYAMVRNACFNTLQHRKVITKFRKQLPAEPVDEVIVENEMIRAEILAEMYNALESLPAGCRRISEMGYLEGKKNQEIADELGISVNTVKTQKQRAMHLLRQKLSSETFGFFILLSVQAGC